MDDEVWSTELHTLLHSHKDPMSARLTFYIQETQVDHTEGAFPML